MARDERRSAEEVTGELLVIGAAQPARLHAQQGVVRSDVRPGERLSLEPDEVSNRIRALLATLKMEEEL